MSTKIQWAESVWNPVVGCTPVSPGCLNCYAAGMAPRLAAMGQGQYVGLTVERGGGAEGQRGKGPESDPSDPVPLCPSAPSRHVFNGVVRCLPERLEVPLRRRAPTVWFVNSMSDLFHEKVPDEFLDRVFAVMAMCPLHTFVILTKRPERAAAYLAGLTGGEVEVDTVRGMARIGCAAGLMLDGDWIWGPGKRHRKAIENLITDTHVEEYGVAAEDEDDAREPKPVTWPLPNVWIGTSVEDQVRADERVPVVARLGAAGWKTCLSVEPLLGPVELWKSTEERVLRSEDSALSTRSSALPLVIVGGESGRGARACDVAWVRGVVGQCDRAGVPVYVKQLGSRPIGHAQWNHQDNEGHGIDMEGRRLRHPKGGEPAEWPEDLGPRACVAGMWGGGSGGSGGC